MALMHDPDAVPFAEVGSPGGAFVVGLFRIFFIMPLDRMAF